MNFSSSSGHITCPHLRGVLTRRMADDRIRDCQAILSPYEFDTFAFRGMSGALVAPVLAHRMQKELIMVRKPDPECHSSLTVEGFSHARKYVLVDDLISTGLTAAHILLGVRQLAPQAALIGLLLYDTGQLLHLPGDYSFRDAEFAARRMANDLNLNFTEVSNDALSTNESPRVF